MIEIGSVITAKVTRVEPYGIYLEHNGETVIVLAPEVAWGQVGDLLQRFKIGESIRVLALRYNYEKKQLAGSIRRLHPEKNPYRQLSRLDPDTVLCGQVLAVYTDGISVRLPNGAVGDIPRHELNGTELKAGAEVAVTIAAVEVDEGILMLRLDRQANDLGNNLKFAETIQ